MYMLLMTLPQQDKPQTSSVHITCISLMPYVIVWSKHNGTVDGDYDFPFLGVEHTHMACFSVNSIQCSKPIRPSNQHRGNLNSQTLQEDTHFFPLCTSHQTRRS